MWGKTRIDFGNTWKGKCYAYTTATATEQQLNWYLQHENKGGPKMKDFVNFIRASNKFDEASNVQYPGSTDRRHFVSD